VWRQQFYVHGLNDHLFFALPPGGRSRCDDPVTFVINNEVSEGVGRMWNSADDYFSAYTGTPNSVVKTETSLAVW